MTGEDMYRCCLDVSLVDLKEHDHDILDGTENANGNLGAVSNESVSAEHGASVFCLTAGRGGVSFSCSMNGRPRAAAKQFRRVLIRRRHRGSSML